MSVTGKRARDVDSDAEAEAFRKRVQLQAQYLEEESNILASEAAMTKEHEECRRRMKELQDGLAGAKISLFSAQFYGANVKARIDLIFKAGLSGLLHNREIERVIDSFGVIWDTPVAYPRAGCYNYSDPVAPKTFDLLLRLLRDEYVDNPALFLTASERMEGFSHLFSTVSARLDRRSPVISAVAMTWVRFVSLVFRFYHSRYCLLAALTFYNRSWNVRVVWVWTSPRTRCTTAQRH